MWRRAPTRLSRCDGRRAAAAICTRPEAALAGSRGRHQRRTFFTQRPRPCLLNIEGLEAPRDFPRLAVEAVDAAKRQLNGAATRGAQELIEALDRASNSLCRIADAAELCRNVHPNQEFVARASEAVQEVAAFMGDVNVDQGMYNALRHAEEGEGFKALDFEAQVVLHHMRVSMENEGVHLPDEQKAACLQLLEREQHLAFGIVQRQEHLRHQNPAEDSGAWVPRSSLQGVLGRAEERLPRRSAPGGEEVFIPAESGYADQVLKSAMCAKARRLVHEAQQASDHEGEEHMAELLAVRQRLAQLRGYRTWNEYAQREALLSSPDRVQTFLDAAWERLRPGLDADLRELAEAQRRLGLGNGRLQAWDIPLILNHVRQEHSSEEDRVADYLTYGSLMRGVDLILSRLLGISFKQEEPAYGEVWHPSVQKYTLREGERIRGILYLDPFMRPGKVVQSAQFTLQGSKKLEGGSLQIPVTTLVYGLPIATVGLPLPHAITFMHEMGHAVHSLLSETTFQHLSGTRGTVDFVEFPSHLFEHFVLDPNCLATYAAHARTGAPMPTEVRRASRRSRLRFAHFEAAQQLMYAAMDQAFYAYTPSMSSSGPSSPRPSESVRNHLDATLRRFDDDMAASPLEGPLSHLLGLSRPSKFDHLVHYGGSYYCYLFNRALSTHIWHHAFRADPFAASSGQRLRELLRGGSVVQSLAAIEDLLPAGAGGFSAEHVPLDAFVAHLSSE